MSFAQFLDAAAVKADATVRYILDGLRIGSDAAPVLILRHAGESNVAWRDAMSKLAASLQGRSGRDPSMRVSMRAAEAKIWSQTVVMGWENVCEELGKPAPCTPAKVEELLLGLQKSRLQTWKAMSAYAENEDNFADFPSGTAGDLGNA